jgi:hypothetical protein
MKRLILNLLLFLIPFILLVYLVPVSGRQRFIQLKEDCAWHGIWFFDRVHSNKKSADIVFLGSSHTINGILDEHLEEQLNTPSLHVVNFGYCRYGENIYPVLLKEILKTKKLKLLFLEVREDENRYSHPIFPYVADAYDIFTATPFFNRDLVRDYFNSFLYRLELLKVQYFKPDSGVAIRTNDFGYMGSADTASRVYLEKVRQKHLLPRTKMSQMERDFYMSYPRFYLKKISELCIKNNIRLRFLYIPEFGSVQKEPLEVETYRKYGEVLMSPREIVEDPNDWADENHLNKAGATKLSDWLAGQIRNKSNPF